MKTYWTMRNGEKIDVDEMSVEHLRNTLKMIIRNNETALRKQYKFTLNGEMAKAFNDDMQQEELVSELDIY